MTVKPLKIVIIMSNKTFFHNYFKSRLLNMCRNAFASGITSMSIIISILEQLSELNVHIADWKQNNICAAYIYLKIHNVNKYIVCNILICVYRLQVSCLSIVSSVFSLLRIMSAKRVRKVYVSLLYVLFNPFPHTTNLQETTLKTQ